MEAWNLFFSDSKISYFGHRGVFFPTFLSFQNLLSLFKIYWVHYISGRSLQLNLCIFIKFTESLLSNSVNLEGPVLEPARSHQINKRIGFQNLLSYSVNSEKTPRVNFPGCFRRVKALQITRNKFCGFVTYTKDTFCKKIGRNRPIVSTARSETIYTRL